MKKILANPLAPWILVGVMFLGFVGYLYYNREPSPPPPPPPIPIPLAPKVVGVDEIYGLGEQVELSLVPFEVKPANLQEMSIIWRLFDIVPATDKEPTKLVEFVKYRKMPDGSILFGSGIQNKEMLVITSVTFLFKDGNGCCCETKCFLLKGMIKIGNGPLPPPPPPPPPPTPPDKFTADILRAWQAETEADKLNKVRIYKTFFEEFSRSVGDPRLKTVGDLRQAMKVSRTTLLGNSLRKLADVIGQEMDVSLPHFDEAVLDNTVRQNFSSFFIKVATALEICR